MKNIFIASSSESLDYANSAKNILEEDQDFKVTTWKDELFRTGESILGTLERIKNKYDVAVFIFHPDDELNFRDNELKSVRDNVIFEFGMFGATIGFKNCHALMPSNIKIKEPSDLLGINHAKYHYDLNDNNIKSTIRSAVTQIRDSIKAANEEPKRNEYLVRGDYRKSIVDSAIHTDITDLKLYESWIEGITLGAKVNEDLLYWDRRTAEKWIRYEKLTNRSISHIIHIAKELERIVKSDIDVVSLGPGTAKKDEQILNIIAKDGGKTWYYPLDVSPHLLHTALRTITKTFDDRYLKVKGIRANFNSLKSLKFIYQYTNNTNLFLLLGNTLGNYNEESLLNNIKNNMFKRDLLLIEVNKDIGNKSNQSKLNQKLLKDFIIQPLISIGVNAEISNLKYESIEGIESSVPETNRHVANYYLTDDDKNLINTNEDYVSVTYSTLYNKKNLSDFLESQGFDILNCHESKNHICYILQKP